PGRDAVHVGRPLVSELAAVWRRDPLRVPGSSRDLAVERHGRFGKHPWLTGASVLAEGLVDQPGARGEIAVRNDHLDPLVPKDAQTPTGGMGAGVIRGDHDAADPRTDDCFGARWCLAVVSARLKR